MGKLLAKPAELCMMSVRVFTETTIETTMILLSMDGTGEELDVKKDIKQVLDKYEGIFATPLGLPPSREHDHRIILKEGTSPINMRPYRYQKCRKIR